MESRTTAASPTTPPYVYPDRIPLADFPATTSLSIERSPRSAQVGSIPDPALWGEDTPTTMSVRAGDGAEKKGRGAEAQIRPHAMQSARPEAAGT